MMAKVNLDTLYIEQIKPLPAAERLRLLAMLAQDLVAQPDEVTTTPKRSILELHGLGKDLWAGIDAQAYVNALRQEWDDRP